MRSSTSIGCHKGFWQQKYGVKSALLLLLSLALVVGCASKPQVSVDDTQNFADIKTFYIQAPLNPINETLANHLSSTITERLITKGLTPTTENEADVSVGYLPSTTTKEDGTTLNLGLGTGTFGRSGGISLGSIFSIPVGEQTSFQQGLQIDIVKDGKFIYSASGSVELESKDSISIQNKLDELVTSLLEQYPARVSQN
ncbi:DUF4136 domain-containing protein [Alteromonas macleodii]|uniref:DUF4136 domain-containing protein n=1 Tax=Alteromonas macleodii TaxID=28108 RepID=A0A6T9Y2C6_ALTMA|nr:DUF4136 domain-containing protein [Alteromonas macleodii]CAB9494864.1 conserved protein of unknown function [Alteromonas macleodii]